MARRVRAGEVLRLGLVNGRSQNAITRTAHVSKHSVQDVLGAAKEQVAARYANIEIRSMPLELMELRCGTASTVFCALSKKKG